jgi:ankyrin repeat protein
MTSQTSLSNFDIRRWHYSLSFDSEEETKKVKKEMKCDPSNPAPPLALIDYYASKGEFSYAIEIWKQHFVPRDVEKSLPLSEKSKTFYSYPDRSGTLKSFASRLFHKNDHSGSMTLSHAAWTGNKDVVEDLLQRNQDSWNTSQPTPLFLATWNGYTRAAEVIVQYRKDWIETPDALGFSPLHIAVQNNDCRLITTLIGAGAQIEATTEDGATPLLIAADMGHVGAAETLLNKGAQLGHKDKEGWCAIHWAAQFGHLEMVQYLCSKAVASISVDEIKANDGTTPMHCAAEVGHLHVVKFLIKNGFKAAPRNKERQTPEMLARKNGYNTVVKVLIEAGNNENDANDSVTNSRSNKRRKTHNIRT